MGSLVNYAEPSINPQDLIFTGSIPSSSTRDENSDHASGDVDAIMSEVDFDAFLDSDMLGPDWIPAASHNDLPSDLPAVGPLQNLSAASELAQFAVGGEAENARYEGRLSLDELTTAVSPSTPCAGNGAKQPAANTSYGRYQSCPRR